MTSSFSTRFAGGSLVAAAILTWGAWMLLPVKVGPFFQPETFPAIAEVFRPWIWLYRCYFFGLMFTVIGFTAFGSLVSESESRVVIWPGLAVAIGGLFVGAIGSAFYYHFGAWGSLSDAGTSAAAAERLVADIANTTEYVTCLVRFARVFGGLGLLLFGIGLLKWRLLPRWTGWGAVLLGLGAMGVTMIFPDNLEYFDPLFHLDALWLAATGVAVWRGSDLGSGEVAC